LIGRWIQGLPGAQGSPGDFVQGEYHFIINEKNKSLNRKDSASSFISAAAD
jgi:hypothetical protein